MYKISKIPIVFIINIAINQPMLLLFAAFQSARPFQKRDHVKTKARRNGGISDKEAKSLKNGFITVEVLISLNRFVIFFSKTYKWPIYK